MTIELRDYQIEAREAVLDYWGTGGGNALVELPTGSGKSLCAASLMQTLREDYPATRILLMTHVQELVEQDAAAIQKLWPEAPIGIYSAGLGRKDGSAPIVFASVQSVFRDPDCVGMRHVTFIDEAHLLSRKDDGQYQRVLKHLRTKIPQMRVVGYTATTFRTDSGLLTDGWRDTPPLFDDVVYRVPVLDLINRGLLCPLVPYAPRTRLDVSAVRKQGGDYVQKELQAAVDKTDINDKAVDEILAAGADRQAWIVFAAGVDHARHLRDVIRAKGVDADMVLGETPKAERRDIINKFKSGQLRCVIGNNVLTTGFDAPHIDLVAMLRPTASKGLHIQMLGRGLRIHPNKSDCLVLDFAGNTLRHGPIDTIDGAKSPGAKGSIPAKECEECGAICHISALKCPNEHPFPIIETPKYSERPSGAPIFSTQAEPAWMDVDSIVVRRHQKLGSPDSLRIDYSSGVSLFSEWLSLEHETAAGMARKTWERMSHSGVAPRSVDEALTRTDDIRIPGRVQVLKEGKFWRIIHKDFSIPPGKIIPMKRALPTTRFQNWRTKNEGDRAD